METGKTVTYGEFFDRAELLAGRLMGHGCQRNDIFAVFAPNSIDFLVTVAAALRIGAVPALVNSQLTCGM